MPDSITHPREKGSTLQDPFNDAPAQDEAQTEAAPAPQESAFDAPPPEAPKKAPAKKAPAKKAEPKVTNIVQSEEGKVVVTLKGGAGFEAPWIVIHADSVEDAQEQMSKTAALKDLMEKAQSAAKYFASLGPAKSGGGNGGGNRGGGYQRRNNAPRQAQEPPADAPPAPGPDWVYKSGTSSRGPWQAWMPPQGSNEKPVWF
ncbi:ribonucleoside reductase class II [Mycobacterium phage Kimona]|uniref:Uncharacterized protein n=1 Tax=Mycobacterium phage Kimona TaxID=2024295 RepID=A0A249XU19_9CAUD|nr:ribonucleoside reductase class II [Mycobacterium phage Kimona]ASZ75485.1 hypothetical protein PBI_KIMONA_49 [Mycobacterium phage Kimona]